MTSNLLRTSALLALSSYANAQFSGGGNPFSGGNPNADSNRGGSGSGNPFSDGGFGSFFAERKKMVTAHAVVATVAFGLLFPAGSILIRLGSFRGLWLVHGLFQIVAYLAYMGAAGIGVYMATHMGLFNGTPDKHIIIGLVLLLALFIQPILGFIHHFAFKKHGTRVTWSYMHIWLGRIIITLGIINGGFGLDLAKRMHMFPPSHSNVVAYAVAATIMWLLYVACAIYGEVKRSRAQKYAAVNQNAPPPYKSEGGKDAMRYA